MSIKNAKFAFVDIEGKKIYQADSGRYFYRRQGKRVYVKNARKSEIKELRKSPRLGVHVKTAIKTPEGHTLIQGPRGGYYYEVNGKTVYVKNPGSKEYEKRRKAQPTTGWKEMAPKKGVERHQLHASCSHCFLLPEEEKFPICKACNSKYCSCEINCKALTAAYVRAKQWQRKHPEYAGVAEKALALKEKHCK
jgi:hypothetical protein